MTVNDKPKLTRSQADLMHTALTLYMNEVIAKLPPGSKIQHDIKETWLQCWNFVIMSGEESEEEVTPGK